MSKMAFICDKEINSLFESLGVDAILLNEKENPRILLEDLAKKGYAIIYMLERFAADFIDVIDMVRKENNISIILVPDHASDLGLGLSLARLATIDAVGTDAIFQKKEGS